MAVAKAEFKTRNEGSYLGVFWYLLNPILTFLLLSLIFGDRLGNNIRYYPLYLLLGVVMFNFFQSATVDSTKIIRQNRWVIKSINFEREALVLGVVIKTLFSHLFEFLLFLIVAIYYGAFSFAILYYFPILAVFSIFTFGACLFLSSLTVCFIDMENIWNFGIRILWLATPVFYSVGGQTKLFYFNLLNPVYYFITMGRNIIIYNNFSEPWAIFGALGCAAVSFLLGILVFNKLKPKFAELV